MAVIFKLHEAGQRFLSATLSRMVVISELQKARLRLYVSYLRLVGGCLHWYVYSVSYLKHAGGRLHWYVNSVSYLMQIVDCLHGYVNSLR